MRAVAHSNTVELLVFNTGLAELGYPKILNHGVCIDTVDIILLKPSDLLLFLKWFQHLQYLLIRFIPLVDWQVHQY